MEISTLSRLGTNPIKVMMKDGNVLSGIITSHWLVDLEVQSIRLMMDSKFEIIECEQIEDIQFQV
jgi:hypothetical protein